MMNRLADLARMQTEQQIGTIPGTRRALVSSYDPDTGTAKVLIQPEGTETGWCSVAFPSGSVIPPAIGAQVSFIPEGGSLDSGIVIGALYTLGSPPPHGPIGPVKSGQALMADAAGSQVFLDGSGNIQTTATGTWTHTGNLAVTGTIEAGHGGADSVKLQSHKHSGTNVAPTANT